MRRYLVTGGSGFIGTNMVADLLARKLPVLSIDIKEPQCPDHRTVFEHVDIREADDFRDIFDRFQPTHVIHLAARTDLDEKTDIEGYAANTRGVENLVRLLSESETVERCIFASSKLVCRNGYTPKSDDDYCPNTLYGQSKMIGEKIVKSATDMNCQWCIVRPTSIWGPWFDIPYRGFFLLVIRGWYFHPGDINPPRSFGYVGNCIYQLNKLLEAPSEKFCGKVFFVSDYEQYRSREWADLIAVRSRGRKVRTVPTALIRLAARGGDVLKCCGVRNPPITSFRLDNMSMDTAQVPLEPMKDITGSLPFSLEQGVDETLKWLRENRLM